MTRSPFALARTLAALAFAAALAACSSLPSRPALPDTHAIADWASTPLSQMAEQTLPGDTRSGFRLLPYGPNALAARVALADRATKSLDIQYFLLPGDNTGLTLMRAARDAARRGVRVRMLLDDLYTVGEDELLLALASLPNVEVRLFNPFPGGRDSGIGRLLASLGDLRRVDRRMHNKLFVADNAMAIAGGRNMADAYVMNATGSNFIDLDVLALGPVVRDLSVAFDRYWNSPVVYPVEAIASSGKTVAELRDQLDRRIAAARPPETADPDDTGRLPAGAGDLPTEVLPAIAAMLGVHREIERGRLGPVLAANARVLVDPPEKIEQPAGTEEKNRAIRGTVTEGVIRWLLGARDNVRMISPYFVPSEQGLENIALARRNGLRVVVVTNSLASTDEPFAYSHYARRLRELLALGVELYELSPSLSVSRRNLGIFGNRRGALHLKEAILDDAQVFLGSMNLDPRSAWLNTEIGLIIDSGEMAGQLNAMGDRGSDYQLRLAKDGRTVEWVRTDDDGKETVFTAPPETSRWLRFKLWLLSPFVPEGEL